MLPTSTSAPCGSAASSCRSARRTAAARAFSGRRFRPRPAEGRTSSKYTRPALVAVTTSSSDTVIRPRAISDRATRPSSSSAGTWPTEGSPGGGPPALGSVRSSRAGVPISEGYDAFQRGWPPPAAPRPRQAPPGGAAGAAGRRPLRREVLPGARFQRAGPAGEASTSALRSNAKGAWRIGRRSGGFVDSIARLLSLATLTL